VKRKLSWFLAVGVALAIASLYIFGASGGGPDIALVHGIVPSAWRLYPEDSRIPRRETRVYSLHRSFGDVVRDLDKAFPTPKWERRETSMEVTYADPKTNASVTVIRERLFPGIVAPSGDQVLQMGGERYGDCPAGGLHGWVTITTSRGLSLVGGATQKLRRMGAGRNGAHFELYTTFVTLETRSLHPPRRSIDEEPSGMCVARVWEADN